MAKHQHPSHHPFSNGIFRHSPSPTVEFVRLRASIISVESLLCFRNHHRSIQGPKQDFGGQIAKPLAHSSNRPIRTVSSPEKKNTTVTCSHRPRSRSLDHHHHHCGQSGGQNQKKSCLDWFFLTRIQ